MLLTYCLCQQQKHSNSRICFIRITHVQGELPMADANIFELTGENVQISYSARGPFPDQPGLQPTITYQDSDQTLTFSGDQIRTQQSEMWSLVSVTLLPSIDAG